MIGQAEAEQVRLLVLDAGYDRVLVLGTHELMATPCVRRPLAASGVVVLAPGEKDRDWIASATERDAERLADLVQHATQGHGARAILCDREETAQILAQSCVGVPVHGVAHNSTE